MSSNTRDGQCRPAASEFGELSPNLQVGTECSEGTQQKQNTKLVCSSKPSEYSQDLLRGVGRNVSVQKFSWFKSMSQIVGLTTAWQQSKVEGKPRGANIAGNAKTNSPVHTEFQLLFMRQELQ